jgi:hypothetical protein
MWDQGPGTRPGCIRSSMQVLGAISGIIAEFDGFWVAGSPLQTEFNSSHSLG